MNDKVPIRLFQCSSPARNSLVRTMKSTTNAKSSSLRTRRSTIDFYPHVQRLFGSIITSTKRTRNMNIYCVSYYPAKLNHTLGNSSTRETGTNSGSAGSTCFKKAERTFNPYESSFTTGRSHGLAVIVYKAPS